MSLLATVDVVEDGCNTRSTQPSQLVDAFACSAKVWKNQSQSKHERVVFFFAASYMHCVWRYPSPISSEKKKKCFCANLSQISLKKLKLVKKHLYTYKAFIPSAPKHLGIPDKILHYCSSLFYIICSWLWKDTFLL